MNEGLKKAAKEYAAKSHKFIDPKLTAQTGFIEGAEWVSSQHPAPANMEQVWNAITANGCREMDFERFQQAVQEIGVKAEPVSERLKTAEEMAIEAFAAVDFADRGQRIWVIKQAAKLMCEYAERVAE